MALHYPQTLLGYCTNVHPARTYDQLLDQLTQHTLAVKKLVSPNNPFPVGLWLSADVARQLIADQQVEHFRGWLHENALIPYTLNGFPHGDFHQPIVKHAVYEPDWLDPERLRYTLDLAHILAALIKNTATHAPPEGSISTLPLGWRTAFTDPNHYEAAAKSLLLTADHLAHIEQQTGVLIHLDLEPEPGCALSTSQDVVDFFTNTLDQLSTDPALTRRHLRVCHDVCHAAVMFEDQREALNRYKQAGISVGKVQLSSALTVPLHRLDPDHQRQALTELQPFHDTRYLHQTTTCDADATVTLHDDLPLITPTPREHRIHYHVPLYLDRIGLLETTQPALAELLALQINTDLLAQTRHYEIETYAWPVIPTTLQRDTLAVGIADEFAWVTDRMTL